MSMLKSIPVLLLSLLLLAPGCSSTSDKVPDDAPPALIFSTAEASREAGDLKSARDLYERVYEDFPSAPEAAEAGWMTAEMMFAREEYKAAGQAYRSFYTTHPLYRLGEIENRVYTVGERLYEDGQSGLLGLGIFPTAEAGLGAMRWITENLPYGSRADDAHMYLARAYMKSREFDEAVIALTELLERYRQSEWVYEARFLLGESYLMLNRGAKYDLGALQQAKTVFSRYVALIEADEIRKTEYADRLTEARERIAAIDSTLARKNLLIAEFYQSVEKFDSAKIYYRVAAHDYPKTDAGLQAGERLTEMEGQKK
jgi:outer membrane protein assembly factor BamD (BamD/ComL family)